MSWPQSGIPFLEDDGGFRLVAPTELDDEFVQSSFCVETEYLKSPVSYIWICMKDEG